MRILFPILVIVPALEIFLLLYAGKTLGPIPTFLLVIGTGLLGAYLAKKQGLATLTKAREQLAYGELPGEAILDGICILLGGAVLLTPGFVTDALGFFLLFPPTRKRVKPILAKWLQRFFRNKNHVTIIRR
ncbi:FxsA family protein [Bacillus sp. CGMCC 1.16541]|uniref:FxsA family protein n=1 Tax=Bacillus sp. CGMCC 1.16541 TaxID=2185143 RepID=UPI000D735A4A|nr:FxsA family protein [Bacillus sp. CGMCC 1.16541]